MKLLIAGGGGHGRVVADAALATGHYRAVAFLDDRHPSLALAESWSVVGKLEALPTFVGKFDAFIAAFGDARLRLAVLRKALDLGFDTAPIVHPSAVVSPFSTLGPGTFVCAGAIVNVGARLGEACIVNTAATIDHDCILDDAVHVCPGAHLAGNVRIGACTWFGIGAVVRQGITVGRDVMVGAGAVVVTDVGDGATVVGNPARPLVR